MPSKAKSIPKQGTKALSSIIRNSKDQLRNAAIRRYGRIGGVRQLISDVRELKSRFNTEDKHADTQFTSTSTVLSSPLLYAITPPAQGDDSNQRDGRSIKVNKIDLNMYFNYSTGTPATSAYQNQVFNWYVIRYLKTPSTNGTTNFTIADFLNNDAGGSTSPLSLPNTDTAENFSVLATGQVNIDLSYNTTISTNKCRMVEITIPVSFHQTFNGTATTTITDNCVFVLITALNPINTGGVSQVSGSNRLWFVDN